MTQTTDFSFTDYDPKRRLVGGGMSDVFLAEVVKDSRPVVIKTAAASADEQTCQRLIKEHRLLLSIDHPNVAKVVDCGCQDGRPFLVLEYIDGESLRERMQPGQPLPWHEATSILQQLSDALAALHAKDILHRDVKPENVLIDHDGHVKLIDLSVATELPELGALTSHDQFLGTVDYMAPEQRHRIGIDARTDQYSLAAVAFEMLTGQCALGQFRRPSDLNPDLDAAVDEVLLQALERDPDDRFDSVESFTAALLATGAEPRDHALPKSAIYAAALMVVIIACLFASFSLRQTVTNQPNAETLQTAMVSPPVSQSGLQVMSNSLGMKFALVPAGTFQMGSSPDELREQFGADLLLPMLGETPQHTVTLSQPFWMGMHEVTVGQFRVFIEQTGYQTTSEKWIAERGRSDVQPIWNDPVRYPSRDNLPVCAVSWEDAVQFCQWLSEREHVTYRLPTEAEWEYACRAGGSGPWCCEASELNEFAVFSELWKQGPRTIGSRRPNRWGLHDMHGNLWEWCQDYYRVDFYETSPAVDPVCRQRPDEAEYRVLRGGGYKAASRAVRSTMRRRHDNHEARLDRGHAIGFRVVRDASSERIAGWSQ